MVNGANAVKVGDELYTIWQRRLVTYTVVAGKPGSCFVKVTAPNCTGWQIRRERIAHTDWRPNRTEAATTPALAWMIEAERAEKAKLAAKVAMGQAEGDLEAAQAALAPQGPVETHLRRLGDGIAACGLYGVAMSFARHNVT